MCLFFFLFEQHSHWMLAFPLSISFPLQLAWYYTYLLLSFSSSSWAKVVQSSLSLSSLCLWWKPVAHRKLRYERIPEELQNIAAKNSVRVVDHSIAVPMIMGSNPIFLSQRSAAFDSFFKLHWLKINTKFYAAKGQWIATNAETLNKALLWNLLNLYRVLLEQVWSGSEKMVVKSMNWASGNLLSMNVKQGKQIKTSASQF